MVQYYDQLADRYDEDRFANSYGRYVDAQERSLLQQWLAPFRDGRILDLGCGTGRLLDLATHGLDASEAMLGVARARHPKKPLLCALAGSMGDFGTVFDAIFCLHLFMHLPLDEIRALLQACFEQLRPGGMLIFDVPSALRRTLTGFCPPSWHAGTALSPPQVATLAGSRWRSRRMRGILSFPIHRLPAVVRPAFRPLDNLVGMTPLKRLCSYVFYRLERPS